MATATPLLPLISAKIGDDGITAIKAAQALISTACSEPLDINNAQAVTARVFDAAGQIAAVIVKAQQ